MTIIVYPLTLPPPQASPLQRKERRALAPAGVAPQSARQLQGAFAGTFDLTFTLRADECAAWMSWWRTDLDYGGAWFLAANWLTPWGSGLEARFIGEGPKLSSAAGGRRTLTIRAEARAGQQTRGPTGLYVMNTTDRNTNQMDNDYLSGYTLRVRWNQIQTGAATYDWALIDQVLQETQARRQRVTLEIFARDLPAHVLADLSEDTWADARGFVTCVPWDANALAYWQAFVAVLAAHSTPLASGAGSVALADHPALETIDAPLVGAQSVRDIYQTLVARPDYTRAGYIDACLAAVQVMRDEFPNKYTFVGVFPMYDATDEPRLDLAVVDALLDEFVPIGTADPKLGFFQELLSDVGPEIDFMGTPLLRAKPRTWIMFQALTNWTTPWTGGEKMASGDVTVGLNYAFQAYGARYVELYAKDIQNPEFQTGLAEWAQILTHGEYPLAPQTAPTVTITEPDEADLAYGTFGILTAVSASAGRTITKVEFFVNGTLEHTDTTAPYAYSWPTYLQADGDCYLEARATDNTGEVGSGYRNCIVQNGSAGPYVDILTPDDGAFVSGIVNISAYVVDIVGVASVNFKINGTSIGTDTSSPYGKSWNSASVGNGAVTLDVIATDTDTNTTTVTFTLYVAN